MKKHPQFVDKESIERELPHLKNKWTINRSKCKFPQYVDEQFSDIERLIKKMKTERHADLIMINIIPIYGTLKHFIDKPKALGFNEIMLACNSADAIVTFVEYGSELTGKDYWKELRSAYVIQENARLDHLLLKELFSADKEDRDFLMSPEERAFQKRLPERMTIYRGCSEQELKSKRFGISWTLNKEKAEWFANRLRTFHERLKTVIVTKSINRKDAVAYFSDRKEEEIIYLGST